MHATTPAMPCPRLLTVRESLRALVVRSMRALPPPFEPPQWWEQKRAPPPPLPVFDRAQREAQRAGRSAKPPHKEGCCKVFRGEHGTAGGHYEQDNCKCCKEQLESQQAEAAMLRAQAAAPGAGGGAPAKRKRGPKNGGAGLRASAGSSAPKPTGADFAAKLQKRKHDEQVAAAEAAAGAKAAREAKAAADAAE